MIKRAYIAGALNAPAVDYIQNVSKMMECAEKVRKKGYSVFVPCLDLLMGIKFGTYNYNDYFYNNKEWLKAADVVFVCPNSLKSIGTQREINFAKNLGIRIEYFL